MNAKNEVEAAFTLLVKDKEISSKQQIQKWGRSNGLLEKG